ncbi:MAG: hypothetical protein ACWA5L_01875 [bacterium]
MTIITTIGIYLAAALAGPSLPYYAAPTRFEAQRAYNELVKSYGNPDRIIIEDDTGFIPKNVADNFYLYSCMWGQEGKISPIVYKLPNNVGYFCTFEVEPHEAAAFMSIGFFTHDGNKWRYFGRIEKTDKAIQVKLPTDKKVQVQPYVDSPYFDGSSTSYNIRSGIMVDNSPYRTITDNYLTENPYNQNSPGPGDIIINAYERDDVRQGRQMEDWVKYPKGTPQRNRTGY